MRFIACTLLLLLLTLGSALADPPPDRREPAKEPNKAAKGTIGDVTCVDGNTVRGTLQSDVALETKYGKLVIPAADIERLEFALRPPDDIAKKIAAAMKRLGDESF